MALILITHDLGLVAGNCRRVNVMYAGRFVEEAPVVELFANPRHPYTVGLLESLPRVAGGRRSLQPIPGQPPDLTALGPGCPFAPRCSRREDRCEREFPAVTTLAGDHQFACFNPYVESETSQQVVQLG